MKAGFCRHRNAPTTKDPDKFDPHWQGREAGWWPFRKFCWKASRSESVQKTIDASSAPSFTVDYSASCARARDNNPFCARRCHDSVAERTTSLHAALIFTGSWKHRNSSTNGKHTHIHTEWARAGERKRDFHSPVIAAVRPRLELARSQPIRKLWSGPRHHHGGSDVQWYRRDQNSHTIKTRLFLSISHWSCKRIELSP